MMKICAASGGRLLGMSVAPVVVTYEDRPEAFVGVELLARSLARHSPELDFVLYAPSEEIVARLADLPRVQWRRTEDLVGRGWNAKPSILLRAIEEFEQVLWLDTDIVVIGDLRALLARFDPASLVVGQEFHVEGTHGGRSRAEAYGLTAARVLPFHVTSGSFRATRLHRPLIEAWSRLLTAPAYEAAQRLPVAERPTAFTGDQDALWATLVSDAFADLQVDCIRTGRQAIVHTGANGYHVRDRLQVLFGAKPAFVHMGGRYKPWSFAERPPRLSSAWLHLLSFELSPFFEGRDPMRRRSGIRLGCDDGSGWRGS